MRKRFRNPYYFPLIFSSAKIDRKEIYIHINASGRLKGDRKGLELCDRC